MDYHDEISVMEHQVTDLRKAFIETLNTAFLRDELEDALRRYWSVHLLEVIRPGKNPRESKYDKRHLWRLLLEPVEAFIAGSDQPAEKFATLKKKDPPTFICNRSIPAGESRYSCRNCAVNRNTILCFECFNQSAHKNHRYKKLEGFGNGYCDCGKPELWKKDFACVQHEPQVDLKDVNFNLEAARIRVPEGMSKRFTVAIRHALCYVYKVFTFRDGVPIPPDLACPSASEEPFPFVTILYDKVQDVNDYDDALEWTQEDASEFETDVDHEGRSPVKFGSEDECQRVKKCVERDSKGQQPLRLDVVQTAAYAHQVFALEVLTWIQGLAEKCEGFRALICDVCLQVSPVVGDHPIVSSFLLEDVRLWKAARRGCHSLFMATFLIFNDAKMEFSRLFASLYTQLMTEFISDDHHCSDSCISLTVQLFTVPTIARTLFSDGLVEVILKSFVLVCQSRRDDQGRLSFDKATQPATTAQFERALHTLVHAGKLFYTVPTSDQWTDALRKGFIGTFEQFLQIMVMMEGMDGYTWSTQSYAEYETNWKRAFDMQFHMGDTINLLQQWCASDNKVLSVCIEKLLTAAVTSHAVMSENTEKFVKMEKKEVAGCFFDCLEYDVNAQIMSIHHPVIRMLAGLLVPAVAKRIVLEVPGGEVPGERVPIEEHLKLHARELLEMPLRTMVLVAQVRRGMWSRNGNTLYHQFISYQHPRSRREMLDKDIVMMQVCAAVMPPDSFLIALLDKFAVLPWTNETFDATSIRAEDDSIGQVMCLAEDFLYGLIVLVRERFYNDVGRVTEKDRLKNEVIHQLCKENMSYSELLQYLSDQKKIYKRCKENMSYSELLQYLPDQKVIYQLCKKNVSYSKLLQYLPDQKVIYQLCKKNVSYSKLSTYRELSKYLLNLEANSSLDELIKKVGVPKELSTTEGEHSEEDDSLEADDFYEWKAELTERYNVSLYHCTWGEPSKAKDTQRERRKRTWKEVDFAPPCPPPFSAAFSRIVHLLDCDVFIHLLKLTVRRALIIHPRFLFDDQLVRMLYLVGYALHEEKRQRLSHNDNNVNNIDNTNTTTNNKFKFLEKAADSGVFMRLRDLQVRSHNETYKNLLEWVLHFYDELIRLNSMDTTEEPPVDSVGDEEDDDVEEKKRRSAVREEQMNDAQSSSASQDVVDLKKTAFADDASSKATAAPYKLVQKQTTSSSDEDLMQLESASMLPQVMNVDGPSDIAAMAIGIDFGTTNVRVARWIDGKFERITDESGVDAFSAYFSRKDGRVYFGQEAREMSTVNPADVIYDFMHFAGREHGKFCSSGEAGFFKLHDWTRRSSISPDEVIQSFLEHVRIHCEKLFGLQEFNLALTVPSYWPKDNRKAINTQLLEAAQRSGFTRVSLIDSQVAATLGCYLAIKDSKTWVKDILVVDVGATDITATVSRTQLEDEIETKTFTVTGTGLGCASVHQALMRYLKNQFVIQHNLPPDTTIQTTSWHRLCMECEKAKVCLLSALTTVLFVPHFAYGYDLHFELTSNTFDDVVSSTIAEDVIGITIAEDVIGITEQVLALSKINIELCSKDDFRLFLVGGGSRIPCIQQRMTSEFGSKINSASVLCCEDAAVIGAAGYAQMIALEPDVRKLDIMQHYRDLCDFFENNGTPWGGDSAARWNSYRFACKHLSCRFPLEPYFSCLTHVTFHDTRASIISSMHGISTNTDRVSCRFSIRGTIPKWKATFRSCFWGNLYNIELTQATAASLQLQQYHMVMLSFIGSHVQEDLGGRGVYNSFEELMDTIRNPLNLCHPNVVRCLDFGCTVPGSDWQKFHSFYNDQDFFINEEVCVRMLLDMRFDNGDSRRLSPSSGWDITLHRFCNERGPSLRNIEIIDKTKQLLKGLSYLHSRDIPFILGSLTSYGILVTADGGTVKIFDILFGLLDKSPLQLHFSFPSDIVSDLLAYPHPDVSNCMLEVSRDHAECPTLTFQPYMDIWSLGCVMLDMVSGGSHFVCADKRGLPLDHRIRREDFIRIMAEGGAPLIPSSAPDIIWKLCKKCFEQKSDRRTDALRLLEMISQIPEDEIDACNRCKPSPKQPSMFTVPNGASYEFNYLSILGRGSYGYVYAIDFPRNGVAESSVDNGFPEEVDNEERNRIKLALKILNNCQLKRQKADLLLRLTHDHVVKYISTGTVSTDTGNLPLPHPVTGILMEYCSGGDLNRLAKKQALSAKDVVIYARQIASGLAYLHDNRDREKLWSIAHGDLKGENIFLTSGTPAAAKIGDLDSLVILKEGQTNVAGLRITQGTPTHMSPEMLAFAFADENEKNIEEDNEEDTETYTDGEDTGRGSTNIGRATDIWSLGCIILEMFNQGTVPYSKKDGSKLAIKSENQFVTSVFLGAHPDLSVANNKEIRQLLEECLRREPKIRPSASDLFTALTNLQS